jgi:transketolase C-terminal domain/subunit
MLRAEGGEHVVPLAIDDFYPQVGTREELLEEVGLTAKRIAFIIEKGEM